MEKLGWKILAIVFIVLFLIETSYLAWGLSLVITEEENTAECYYNICADYPQADYANKVCNCYDYDEENRYEITLREYMK